MTTLMLRLHIGTLPLDTSPYNTFTLPPCHLRKTILSTKESNT